MVIKVIIIIRLVIVITRNKNKNKKKQQENVYLTPLMLSYNRPVFSNVCC